MTDSRSAHILAASSFILLLGIFSYWNIFAWFPTVVLSSGISLILGLIVKKYFVDVSVTLILFACLFFFSFTDFFSRIFLPAFLIIGAFYYLLRQFFDFNKPHTEKDHG